MRYILPLLADWANGLFALMAAAYITQTEVVWWHVPVALLLSHLPDIDAVPELLRRGKVSASAEHARDHRTFLHFPIISIPLGIITAVLFGFWGWVILLAIVLHLVNDLYGTGWGLPLFWPFSARHYKVLGRRANRLYRILQKEGDWDRLPEPEKRLRLVVSWDESEFSSYINRWGVDDWIDLWYLRLNWISVVEYALFICACVLLLATFV